MGVIIRDLIVRGDRGGTKLDVIFDSGAGRSIVRKDAILNVASIQKALIKRTFILADSKTKVTSDELVHLWITIGGKTIDDVFYVVKKLRYDIVIGALTMQVWDIKLYPRKEKVVVGVDPRFSFL